MNTTIVQVLTLVAVLVAIIGVPWYLRGRLDRLHRGVVQASHLSNSLLNLVGHVIRLLHKRKSLTDDELRDILVSYTDMSEIPETLTNPLTPEEASKLNHYVARARRGDFFVPEEVTEYNYLVWKVQEERKNDPDIWPLVSLGAFLLGLFLGSKSKK